MPSVIRDAQTIWFGEKVRRAGFADLDAFAAHFELRPFRLRQIYHAATKELAGGISDVSTLPKALRSALTDADFSFDSVTPVLVQRSNDRQTSKGLFRLSDGSEVEAVLMEHHGGRNTVCISSQAGCAFACAFCSTGQAGFTRQLQSTEIFDQARYFSRELAARGERITNVVFMGMGEPFHNYEAVMNAVALFNDPQGFNLGHRHITISTVGLVDKIDAFTQEGVQVNLAISLHAPNDQVRSGIMPVNRKFSMDELLAACDRYIQKTRRKVFFEYVMLAGVNDLPEHARELAQRMKGHLYHVNLIPYNTTPDALFSGTQEAQIWQFASILNQAGVPTTVRANMGRDITAACGQLRAETQPKAHAIANATL
ncbi:MAG TPA: 23S rRNA (adenine(2503)-C(2))-methyltransferase RlmN [Candidatus Baltobacteraceae bacterium]|jgi:23S rRNA (adenine2503-C2)-methyltransferase|nr:23S rRNA (adenine(2503)-C(2))-methyltransferase RlmN [Candidatus Baltobacteraceae bacterium]